MMRDAQNGHTPRIRQTVRKSDILLLILFLALICGIRLLHMPDMKGLIVFDDEMGYWSHAANLAGLSFDHTTATWYSYGWSLLLAPLFSFTRNMDLLYRLAILINLGLSIAGYFLSVRIIRELKPELGTKQKYTTAFAASCFSAYIFQSYIAWSETFLYTAFLLTVLLGIYFFRSPGVLRGLFFALSGGLVFLIHNRAAVVPIAILFVLLAMGLKRSVKLRTVLVIIGVFAAVFWLDRLVRARLTELAFGGDGLSFHGNDMAEEFGKLKTCVQNFGLLLESVCGKVWYMMCAMLSVGFFGLAGIVRMWKEEGKKSAEERGDHFLALFLLLTILFTIALAAVTMIYDETGGSKGADAYFYGRYSDMLCGILIIFGFFEIFRKKKARETAAEGGAAAGLLALVTAGSWFLTIRNLPEGWFVNVVTIPGVMFFSDFRFLAVSLITAAALAVIILLMFFAGKRETVRRAGVFFLAAGMCVVFWVVSETAYLSYIRLNQKVNHSAPYEELYQAVRETPYPLYYRDYDAVYEKSMPIERIRRLIRVMSPDAEIFYRAEPQEEGQNYLVFLPLDRLDDLAHPVDEYRLVSTVKSRETYALLAHGKEVEESLASSGFEHDVIRGWDGGAIQLRADTSDRTAEAGEVLFLDISLFPDGQTAYLNPDGIDLSYHIFDEDGNMVIRDGRRAHLGPVTDGETVLKVDTAGLESGRTYIVKLCLVQEEVAWLPETENTSAEFLLKVK